MRKFTIIIILFYNVSLYAFGIDKSKMEMITQNYINSIIEYSEKIDISSYINITSAYNDLVLGTHHNELNKINYDYTVEKYLFEIKEKYNGKIIVKIINEEILNCSNSFNGKVYGFSRFTKIVELPNQSPISFTFLMIVDITKTEYKIDQIILCHINEKLQLVKNCSTINNLDEQIRGQELLQSQIKSLIEEASNYYSQLKYNNALKAYELIIKLDKNNQDALDGIKNCNYLITAVEYENTIENYINNGKFSDALVELERAKSSNIKLGSKYIADKTTKCNDGLKQQRINSLLNLGDSYYINGQYKQAREKYEDALNFSPNNSNILNKIEDCKNGDPQYIQKQLAIAYNNAMQSKKNYLSTFKTYKKFENSKLLTGSNYLFMMLMMLDKPSTVVKPMGYSNNLALNLAKEYFYKAKNKGIDVSFYETQIFTKSIEKRNKY
jgi:tetratricopeptide (TPR) repeat protein